MREKRPRKIGGLHEHFATKGKPKPRRSREIALGTLRRVLSYAVAQEIITLPSLG